MERSRAEGVLRSTFGVAGFRPGQWRAVEAALGGRDVCVFLPTGAGKSLCYQLPAVLSESGVVLVISPLLSLIADQVSKLRAAGVAAGCISSMQSKADNDATRGLLKRDPPGLRLLYLSPETVASEKLLGELGALGRRGAVKLVAVDEAHCVSSWGHDFRAAYLKVGPALRRALPETPLMALSATATADVRADLSEHLRLRSPVVVASRFDRAEIHYDVVLKDALPEGDGWPRTRTGVLGPTSGPGSGGSGQQVGAARGSRVAAAWPPCGRLGATSRRICSPPRRSSLKPLPDPFRSHAPAAALSWPWFRRGRHAAVLAPSLPPAG